MGNTSNSAQVVRGNSLDPPVLISTSFPWPAEALPRGKSKAPIIAIRSYGQSAAPPFHALNGLAVVSYSNTLSLWGAYGWLSKRCANIRKVAIPIPGRGVILFYMYIQIDR
jgi:hypothetical protein